MVKKIFIFGLMCVALQSVAKEESNKGIDTGQIYFGGGLGFNDANFGDNAIGFQIFAGMPLPVKTDVMNLSVEVGYMDSGNFEKNFPLVGKVRTKANGLWGTAVANIPMNKQVDLIGRIGLDIGDDDGIMIGAGVGFDINRTMDLRVEYVIRDTIDSLQVNLVIRQ